MFILPFAVLFLLFFLLPIGYGVWQSLFSVERSGLLGGDGGEVVWAGLSNYVTAVTNWSFVASIGRIMLFGIVQVPITIGLAVVLALLLDVLSVRWASFFRGAYFLPYGVPGVIASILWAFLYTPGLSPILDGARFVGLSIDPLSKANVLWAVANIVIWQMVGYNVLIISAQLKAIPGEIYESATLDGANSWAIARHVKLPLVLPAISLTLLFTIIGTLQLFSEPLILRTATGNITSTYTPNMSAYSQAFQYNDYHAAAAQAVLLALLTFAFSIGLLRTLKGQGR